MKRLVPMLVAALVVATLSIPAAARTAPAEVTGPAAAAASAGTGRAQAAGTAASTPLTAARVAAAVAAARTPAAAVAAASAHAAANGATLYIAVLDRSTGATRAETGNAGAQVGSESIMKLMIATYYLLLYGGYSKTPSAVRNQLSYMLRYSDDGTANSLFTANAIPTVAARYGMRSTINATDRPGHWGASRITARDMARFLYRAARDGAVGPWLIPVMAQTAALGSDGFNQHFGLNSLSGTHGSKQGWGCDSFFTAKQCAIHSVGYTDRYFVSLLQLSDSYPDPLRANSNYAAALIQTSRTAPAVFTPREAQFVRTPDHRIYRIVGGAPVFVSSWSVYNGAQPSVNISAADFARLPRFPRNGTIVLAGHDCYVIAGGAPVFISNFAHIGGTKPCLRIDPLAISRASSVSPWNHLNGRPSGGTILKGGSYTFVVAGGAPVRVRNLANIAPTPPAVRIDLAAVSHAGRPGVWNHLFAFPVAGTFVQASRSTYRVAGGAPILVTSWAPFGGPKPTVRIDPFAVYSTVVGDPWNHLRFYPADGTLLQGLPGRRKYRVSAGKPLPYSGAAAGVQVSQLAIDRAGRPAGYSHLRKP